MKRKNGKMLFLSLLSILVVVIFSILLSSENLSTFSSTLSFFSYDTALAFKPTPPSNQAVNDTSSALTTSHPPKANAGINQTVNAGDMATLDGTKSIDPAIAGFQTYQNSTFGFKMKYPANWNVAEFDYDPSDPITDIVTFTSPFENRADKFVEHLIVSSETILDPSMTAEKYANETINYYQDYYQTDVKLMVKNTTNVNISGKNYPVFTLIYSEDVYDDENNRLINMEKGYLVDGRAYVFHYPRNNQVTYPEYLPIINQMIDSFELINSSSVRTGGNSDN